MAVAQRIVIKLGTRVLADDFGRLERLGPEGITYLRERDLRRVITKHMEAKEADLKEPEGRGALNFLALDDLPRSTTGKIQRHEVEKWLTEC